MKTRQENTDLTVTTLGLIVIFIVILFANKFIEPVKAGTDNELAGEKFGGIFQGIESFIINTFSLPAIPEETSYNLYLNLMLPFLLVCLACGITIFIMYHLVKSLISFRDILLNKLLTVIFIFIFISVFGILLMVLWHLFFLLIQ